MGSRHDKRRITKAVVLFRQHAEFVARVVRRMGVAIDDVDDLVQEVFLVAHRRGGHDPALGSPTSWLAAIAFRLAANRRRKHYATPDDDVVMEAASNGAGPLETLITTEALRQVQRALDTLPAEQKLVVVLVDIEGEPCPAIAQALKLPVGTIYSRLAVGRERFQAAFQRQALRDRNCGSACPQPNAAERCS